MTDTPQQTNDNAKPRGSRGKRSADGVSKQFRGLGAMGLRYIPWILTAGLLIWVFGLFDLAVRGAQEIIWTVRRPTAMIFVESPEVYTRERLINERLAEETWLNEQLPTTEDVTSQANSYLRFLDRSSLSGRLTGGDGDKEAAPATNIVDEKPPLPERPTPAGPPAEAFPMAFDQRFQLMSAYRSLIRQRIIENRLDDRHDLEGNALYILKFDTTVAGVPRYGERAIVTVRISPPAAIAELSNAPIDVQIDNLDKPIIYASASKSMGAWMNTVEARINAAIARRLQRFRSGAMSPSELAELRAYLEAEVNGGTLARLILDEPNEVNPSRDAAMEATTGFIAKNAIAEVTGDSLLDISLSPTPQQPGKNRYWKILGRAFRDYVTMGLEMRPRDYSSMRVKVTPYLGSFTFANEDCVVGGGSFMQPVEVSGRSIVALESQGEQLMVSDATKLLLVDRAVNAYRQEGPNATHRFFRLQDNRTIFDEMTKAGMPPELIDLILTGAQRCEISVSVPVEVGLVNFVSKIGRFNTYSYSVLPRENPISVFSDIARTTEAMVALSNLSGERHVEQSSRGWSLRAVLTTFGDVTRVKKRTASTNAHPEAGSNEDAESADADVMETADSGTMQPIVGWIIDPGARAIAGVNDDKPSLAAESVLAIISVPAWWSEITLDITRGWLKGNERFSGLKTPDGNEVAFADQSMSHYDIKLPNRPEFLDTLLLDVVSRQPVISEVDMIAPKDVRGGQPCERVPILVTGPRLWRNTAVTIGSVKATQIEVLPNMEGIIATFKLPTGTASSSWEASGKLRVWTSEGVAEYPQSLTIQRAEGVCRILLGSGGVADDADEPQGTTTPVAVPQTQGDPSGRGAVGQVP